ncbi:MAG: glycosyltransferase family 87 protein [Anaerolineales bacterium]
MIKKQHKNATLLISLFLLSSLLFIIYNIYHSWAGIRVDFPSFYYATDLAFSGVSPYNRAIWNAVKSIHLPNRDLYPFLHIPFSLVLFYPISLVDIQVSQSILFILNIAATFLLIYLLFIKILRKSILDPFVIIGGILILLFPPVLKTISHGQVNLIVIVLICTFWWVIKENKSSLTISLLLAVSILLKVYPGILLLYLLIKKKFKSILLTVGIIVFFSLIGFLIFPTEIWTDWYSTVGSVKYGGVFFREIPSWKVGNQSFNGFITRFFMGVRNRDIVSISDYFYRLKWSIKWIASSVLGYLSLGFSLLIWMVLALRKRMDASNETRSDLEISMLLLTMYLVAPISWYHHLVFILPPIFVLLNHFIGNNSLGVSFWVLVILSGILFVNFNLSHPLFQNGLIGIFVSMHFFSVLGIWFVNLITIHNLSRINEPESL